MIDATNSNTRVLSACVLLLSLGGVLSCSTSTDLKPKPTSDTVPAHSSSRGNERVLGVVPEFTLLDQRGQQFDSRDMFGKLWIANFIFTRCVATCPEQTAHLARLQGVLSRDATVWKDVRLLSFTVDPEFDTPEVLLAYADQAHADPDHWHFLTGPREPIWELCRDGFKLPVAQDPEAKAPITHTPLFAIVDPYFRIRGYYELGDERQLANLEASVRKILAERFPFPAQVLETDWLEKRSRKQVESLEHSGVYHDFKFEDRREESGIRFRHHIVDDAGKNWKPCHYDHGNGVAAADVDGDGLTDLYFTNQIGRNELWRNLGDGKFEDITAAAGVAVDDRISVSASFADVDNDGDADLYVTTVRGGNVLFENDGHGHFQDISIQSGLDYSGHSSSAEFFDFDRDGLLDLFLVNVGKYTGDEIARGNYLGMTREDSKKTFGYYVAYPDSFSGHLKPDRAEQSRLYRNLGQNRFRDVSAEVGLQDFAWSGDATPVDLNADGWQDLYVLNMQGHDECYVNVEGKRFEKRSREFFPKTSWGSMGVKAFDYDNDGDQDLLITDMHSDMSTNEGLEPNLRLETAKSEMLWPETFTRSGGISIWGNSFFRNDGAERFSEVSDSIGAENYWPWGVSVGDLNADGYADVFVASSMNFPWRYAVNSVWLNDRGERFRDSAFVLGVEPRRDRKTAVPWFELDLGGEDRDHFMKQALMFMQQPLLVAGRATEERVVVWGSVGSRSSVIFDIDNDGDLDIVTNDFNSEPLVLVNDLAKRKQDLHYIQIRLIGSKSNRDGLGAVVNVRSGAGNYSQVHDGQSGYLSQSLVPLYFGLGDATTIDGIDVLWPSGIKQTLEGPLGTNTLLELREPQAVSGDPGVTPSDAKAQAERGR